MFGHSIDALLCVGEPGSFEFVFGGALGLVVDAELSGAEVLAKIHCSGDGVHFLRLFIDEVEDTTFAWVSVIEGSRVEHGALGKSLYDRESGVENGALEHGIHVLHLRGVGAGDEGCSTGDKLRHGVDRLVDRSSWVGLGLAPERGGGRGLILGQAVDEVVHHDVGKVHVLPSGVVQVVASD